MELFNYPEFSLDFPVEILSEMHMIKKQFAFSLTWKVLKVFRPSSPEGIY